ncbi:DUF4157 domain-containing protein [Leptolyngbyaceae cyanobacterium UHCC 1019]
MGLRSHAQKKVPQQSALTPVQSQVRSRPFAVQPQPETSQQETPDLQTQIETAQRFGHSFSKIAASKTAIIQPKLTIGAPGDKYEQEADRVAQQVVQRINAPDVERSQLEQSVQRETVPEEEELQMKPLADQIQRVELPDEDKLQMKPDGLQRETMLEEDEELQKSPMLQRQASEAALPATTELESAIQQSRGSGQALTDTIRQPLEQAFGNVDFSGVKVHTDAQSDKLNRSIHAKAFTTGQDIFFRQGAYQPENHGGQELIAHELTHVVQQNGGTVQRSQREFVHQRSASTALSLPNITVQRALGITVDQYKTASDSKGSGSRKRVKAVDRALADYHQDAPRDRLGIKSNGAMTPEELQDTRHLLDNLMVEIDTYLALGDIAEKRKEGTYALRVHVQNERMYVTKSLANKGGFSTKARDNEVSEAVKTDPASFINWLGTHPEYLKWAGQGAGACITSVEALEPMLKAIFKDVYVKGLLAFATSDATKVANHFVVVVNISGQDIVVDPTQIQFLGGNPQVAAEATWRQRLQAVKIAFAGSDYEPAQVIKVKDCGSCAEAIAFAGEDRRKTVQLVDVAGEADL